MKYKIALSLLGALSLILGIALVREHKANKANFSGVTSVYTIASSTVDTLTTTSKQLFATSTKRTALSVQPINCTLAGALVRLNLYNDAAAVVYTGFGIFSTTTQFFFDANLPPPQTSIRGITDFGTCTVILTEWRTS